MNNQLTQPTLPIKVFVFRTNIKTKKKAKAIKPLLNNLSNVIKWSIDYEDIDNVLRIEAKEYLDEGTLINYIKNFGYQCEALTDKY